MNDRYFDPCHSIETDNNTSINEYANNMITKPAQLVRQKYYFTNQY